jgi:transposase, IS5 family
LDKQISFSELEYASKKRQTRRDLFLNRMEDLVPWADWLALIEPYYPRGDRGRPPIGCERMLRLYLLQAWYNLSAERLEDAVCDSQSLRRFSGIDLAHEAVPDSSTVQHFRHLLEKHELTKRFSEELHSELVQQGLLLKEGSITEATITEFTASVKTGRREYILLDPSQ